MEQLQLRDSERLGKKPDPLGCFPFSSIQSWTKWLGGSIAEVSTCLMSCSALIKAFVEVTETHISYLNNSWIFEPGKWERISSAARELYNSRASSLKGSCNTRSQVFKDEIAYLIAVYHRRWFQTTARSRVLQVRASVFMLCSLTEFTSRSNCSIRISDYYSLCVFFSLLMCW